MKAEGIETARRILCVFPRYTSSFGTFEYAYPLTDGVQAFMPPQGLLLIAAYLPANWSVRLIDDDAADVWHLELAPLDQFQDASWRAHHNVRLGFKLFDLSIGRRATDQQHRADRAPCILREVAGLTMDLDGQLVRWRNDHDLGACLRRINTRKEG